MSSSFFLKGKPKPDKKRKIDSRKPARGPVPEKRPKDDEDEEIDSDAEADQHSDTAPQFDFSDEEDVQTPQDKRLKLAKKYLDEIEKEERSRAEDKELHRTVSHRLNEEYLDSVGKLRKKVAGELSVGGGPVRVLRSKHQKLPVTCVCVSADNRFLFSGSKTAVIVKWDLADMKAVGSFNCAQTRVAVEETTTAPPSDAKKKSKKPARPHIIAMALSSDFKFLAVSDSGSLIHIWCPRSLNHLHTFQGHRDTVTALVFRLDTHSLYSASKDRSVKIWSLDEMAYIESLFGHQSTVTGIDALSRERAITAGGYDCTIRIWKIAEESQLIYNGHRGSIENVKLINEQNFLSSGVDGSLCLWSVMKKKPLCVRELAHGVNASNGEPNWISAIATLINTDVIASGACDGSVKLWKLGDHYRTIELLFEVPVSGFINGLAFTSDAQRLIVAVGQEHRLGRWWRIKEAVNSILVVPLERNTKQ